ncbi:unnamed protein product [Rotaria magnacalcarata]|uniref:Uncharacterized protein n=1 Tax=Rotaria magnacalcarata TaxID=392030 RepID=A0A8S3IV12_9BILA|nr:unnamed protein product [Rotaria magnacalcarata]
MPCNTTISVGAKRRCKQNFGIGKLHRNDYTNQQHVFSMKDQDFLPLGESKKPRQAIWNHVQTEDYKIRRKRAESPPMQNISPSTVEEINTGKILNVKQS